MKKIAILISSAALLSLSSTYNTTLAQDTLQRDTVDQLIYSGKVYYPVNVIKTNPLAVLWAQIPFTGELRLMYERAIGSNMSSFIGVSYVVSSVLIDMKKLSDSLGVNVKIRGYRIQAGHKFYLTKFKAPKGFYLAPHLSYNKAKLVNKANKNDYLQTVFFNVNVLTGFQLIIGGNFAIDIFTGLGFKSNTWVLNIDRSVFKKQAGKSGLKLSFGLNFGYAF